MELLIVAATLIGAVSLLVKADSCSYDDCVYQNIPSRYSGTEVLLVYFNITKIPDDLAEQCAILVDRAATCEDQKVGCPSELKEDWENRMHDPVYVKFVIWLGNDYCQKPEKLFGLRDCFTDELQNGIQSCIQGNYGFDFECIREQYKNQETCPDEADETFYDIVDNYLIYNPYYTSKQ